MTREEAIKFLTLMRKAVSNFEEYGHDKASMVIECDKAEAIDMAIEALSADAISREEYKETDGVVTIEKQNANEVGEIKHIVVCSPNYTRYFYNDSMPTQYKLPFHDEIMEKLDKLTLRGDTDE